MMKFTLVAMIIGFASGYLASHYSPWAWLLVIGYLLGIIMGILTHMKIKECGG